MERKYEMKKMLISVICLMFVVFFSCCNANGDKTEDPKSEPETPEVYLELQEKYKAFHDAGLSFAERMESELNYMFPDCEKYEFAVSDIDGNGSEEMLVKCLDPNDFFKDMVFDLYTLDEEGKPVLVFAGAERDRYYATENADIFRHEGSNSAFDSFSGLEKYENGEMVEEITK